MNAPRYATLQDYLRVIRERALLIAAITAVVGGLALFNAARKDPVYAASASISFNDPSEELGLLGSSAARLPAQQAALSVPLIRGRTVAERVQRALGSSESPQRLASLVSARIETATAFVVIEARSSEASQAAKLANAFAVATVDEVTARTRKRYTVAARNLREQLSSLGDRANSLNYAILDQRRIAFRTLAILAEPASVNRSAFASRNPVSPRPVRDTILGVAFGLMLGLLAAFLRDVLDSRLRRVSDIERQVDLPLLARTREETLGSTGLAAELAGPDAESFRMLRANLEFLDLDNAPKVVLVTSALAEEGKSTVAAWLATSNAAAGKRTLLVECDLRKPVLAERMELGPGPGLADYLLGSAEPSDVVRSVPLPHMHAALNGVEPSSLAPGEALPLAVIPAGARSPRPGEMLGSSRMVAFLDQVREVYDMIVLDTPPLLVVADPLTLVPLADAVALCIRTGETTSNQARAARLMLAQGPGKPVGLVATGVKPGDKGEYVSYYDYSQRDATATAV